MAARSEELCVNKLESSVASDWAEDAVGGGEVFWVVTGFEAVVVPVGGVV
jgi:hypothetical protein